MVDLLFTEDREVLSDRGVIRTIYDPACGTGGMLTVAEDYLRELNPHGTLVPHGQDWKKGVCRALGWPPDNTGAVWQAILKRVGSYKDLEPELLGRVEELIDFVTDSGGA